MKLLCLPSGFTRLFRSDRLALLSSSERPRETAGTAAAAPLRPAGGPGPARTAAARAGAAGGLSAVPGPRWDSAVSVRLRAPLRGGTGTPPSSGETCSLGTPRPQEGPAQRPGCGKGARLPPPAGRQRACAEGDPSPMERQRVRRGPAGHAPCGAGPARPAAGNCGRPRLP